VHCRHTKPPGYIFIRFTLLQPGCIRWWWSQLLKCLASFLELYVDSLCKTSLRNKVRRPIEKFVDSTYYSGSELCGGAVTVSFSKYLPRQAIHFLQRSTHFSKTCCRRFAASFRRIVEQAVLTSRSFRARSSLFMVSMRRLRRLDGWVVGFPIHFFQVEHKIQSRNAPLRKYLSCSAILKMVLL
jgi:hypothetical protein